MHTIGVLLFHNNNLVRQPCVNVYISHTDNGTYAFGPSCSTIGARPFFFSVILEQERATKQVRIEHEEKAEPLLLFRYQDSLEGKRTQNQPRL